MLVQTKSILKSYFETGDAPTQAQFAELIDSIYPAHTYVVDSSFKATGGHTVSSNSHYIGRPGVVITCDDTVNRSGLLADNAENIILENLTIDLKTTAYDGVTTPPKNDWPNFTTAVDFRNCQRIWIKNCRFINTGSAHPDWTMQATNMQNINGLFMTQNHSIGCQYKLCGASASLENVFFGYNYGRENTQMGMSFVVQPQGDFEVASLQITAGATASSSVTVTLGGVAFTVAVVSGDTAVQVADKIRATAFTGWTTGGTAGTSTVTFTATVKEAKTDATYSAGTTGATGTMTTTTQGWAANLRLANIHIVNNIFEQTDQHSIYGGIDNGAGVYPGTVTIENINIANNLSNGTAYLNTTQTSKGILMNLTRDTRHVSITNNQIIGQADSTQVQGIQVNTSPEDAAAGNRAKNVTINYNNITECENFNIVADDIDFFEIRGNKCQRGKGIITRRSNDGDIFDNKFRDTGGASVRIEDNCSNMRTDKKLADDTAAAAHGIAVGEFYYKTGTGIVPRAV